MKKLILPFFLFLFIIVSGCAKKTETSSSSEDKIAGQAEKTWIAIRETNAQGENDKLTRDEKKEKITFWRNGNVKMGDNDQAMSGQWSYEGSNLTLHFAGQDVTENFTIVELTNDRMRLKAGDGSELVMKPN